MKMWIRSGHLAAVVAVTASLTVPLGQASAAPMIDHLSLKAASQGLAENVYWRGRGWGWGGPVAGGIIAGALIGGALAAPRYYGPYGYGYGYGYAPGYYAPPPAYVDAPPPGDDYCFRRFKSYDPASGTYLGYDGLRHPCP
ncbi:MAG: BA14K family protein [Pseudomonadota bacterium]